jgi:hypothetical protein
MNWIVFVVGAILSWGTYGVALSKGQQMLGPLKALLGVGLAYFLIAVLVPSLVGGVSGFSGDGAKFSLLGGTLGALGAVCIIYAFRNGGTPLIVMPLVFGGAPLVNAITTMIVSPPKESPSPMLYVGFVLAALGGGLVLYNKPH